MIAAQPDEEFALGERSFCDGPCGWPPCFNGVQCVEREFLGERDSMHAIPGRAVSRRLSAFPQSPRSSAVCRGANRSNGNTTAGGHGGSPLARYGPYPNVIADMMAFAFARGSDLKSRPSMADTAADRTPTCLKSRSESSRCCRYWPRRPAGAGSGKFRWLTAGAGGVEPAEPPVCSSKTYRWLVCCNTDTPAVRRELAVRPLKEWPWQLGRAQFLADLAHGKKITCDGPFGDATNVEAQLAQARRTLTSLEQARLRQLGKGVAHALEATCRTCDRGESEEELAGQVGHRLIRHGMEPVTLFVAADGRGRRYRRGGATAAKIERTCIVQTTARKWGLHVTASRTFAFGPADESMRRDHATACSATAVQILHTTVKAKAADILSMSERVMQANGLEHEWRSAPVGWLTGFAPVELTLTPTDAATELEAGHAIVLCGGVGGAANADTVLVTAAGPQIVTPPEGWPVKRIKLGSVTVDRPDILIRNE